MTDRCTGRCTDRVVERSANGHVSGHIGAIRANEIFLYGGPPLPLPAERLPAASVPLGERDIAVLRSLAPLPVATTAHLQRLHFARGSPQTRARRTRRTLQRLHSLGLIARLARRVGGVRAGSAGHVHQLTPKGRRLLGLDGPRGGTRRTLPEPSARTLTHRLAVTEIAVSLHEANHAGICELVRFETEPTCWRTYLGPGGNLRHVRPDSFVIVARGDWEHLWFLEVDLGTETLTTIARKADAYRAYAASGQEQRRWDVFPRVAYLTSTTARRDAIGDALSHTPDADALGTVALLGDATATLTAQAALP